MPLVVPLTEVGQESLSLAGGKGAQLGAMLRASLSVPDGFCVTTEAFRAGMSDELRAAIVRAYRALGSPAVAVRSSATAEDLPDASFAGQQDTYLNVRGDDAVVVAVQDCWKSMFTERAVAYRRDRNIPDASVAMAVVVQRMVAAEAAGVLFTVHPVSGAIDELVIEAALGLGDKVVSAQVTPDRYRLKRRSPHEVIEREGEETAALLTPLLGQIAELGLACERLLGRAADVEWAVAGGNIFLLQARTVTAAGTRAPVVRFGSRFNAEFAKTHLVFWGNYNMRDTMPFPHTPFSWSFWNYLVMPCFLKGAGFIEHADECEMLPAIGDLVDGRAYFNMNFWSALFSPKRFPRLSTRFAGMLDAELPEVLGPINASGELVPMKLPFRVWHGVRAIYRIWSRANPKQAWKDLEFSRREVDEFSRTDMRLMSEEQIVALARHFATENMVRTLFPLLASGPSLPAATILSWCLERWGLAHLLPRLISGLGRNPTVETALAIWDLAQKADGEVRRVLASEDVTRIPEVLEQSEAGQEFLAQMAEFLKEHGHRAVREFDFSCPRWRDDPTFVYESVRNYLAHPSGQATPRQHYENQKKEHAQAKEDLRRGLHGHPLRRLLAAKLVRVIEERMPLREAFKFYTLYGAAHARDLLLEVARRLAERGLLEKPDDYFFLSIPEIEKLSTGQLDQAWVREQVAVRRRELAANMRIDPPLIVRSDGKAVMRPAPAGQVMKGAGASPGVVRGPARVLFDPTDGARLHTGEILVAKFTDPSWTPLFLTAAGLIMEVGGIVSHGAIVAREYGIPAVVGVKGATRILRQGERVEVNGSTGEVIRIEERRAVAAGA
ncbi:MAG TPA: PEP/pyruvate-binding domain-containing protein [Terriglobales bacterium]|nr:PEP/pyruvate-binding domain-containing protein [Terriglobales bacterium]